MGKIFCLLLNRSQKDIRIKCATRFRFYIRRHFNERSQARVAVERQSLQGWF